jgi:chromosome segregation ATPase
MTALRISVSIGFLHLSVEQARGQIRFDWGMLCPKTSAVCAAIRTANRYQRLPCSRKTSFLAKSDLFLTRNREDSNPGCLKMLNCRTYLSQFLKSEAPEVVRKMPAEPKQKTNMLPSMMGVGTLCLVAIAAQSAGLMSVVRFVTTREGWEAQKSQFSAVTSEWEQMSSTTKAKIEQFRQEEVQAEQKRVAAEKELEDVLKRLATVKGELDAVQQSASSALDQQRRSQSEEQASLDVIQRLKGDISDLTKRKTTLENQLDSNGKLIDTTQSRIVVNQTTLESQDTELKDNEQKRQQLETSLKTARENLRKVNDELLASSDDLAEALKAKKEATIATDAAMNLAKEVETLKSEKAKLSGEMVALSMQKQEQEKELATSDSRMNVARTKLSDYLDKWNNRDKLSQEIDDLNARVTTLKKSESDTTANIAKLTDQSIKLETKTKTLVEEIKTADSQLTELKNKQKEVLAELVELQKLKKQAEGSGDK